MTSRLGRVCGCFILLAFLCMLWLGFNVRYGRSASAVLTDRSVRLVTTCSSPTSTLASTDVSFKPLVAGSQEVPFKFHKPGSDLLTDSFFNGGVEQLIGTIFYSLLQGSHDGNHRPLVIDVGLNDGWYTLLSAKLGAEVLSFELQPGCVSAARQIIAANSFESHVRILHAGVGNLVRDVHIPCGGCDGAFQRPGAGDKKQANGGEVMTVAIENMDATLRLALKDRLSDGQQLLLIKMDIEGAEAEALYGLQGTLRQPWARRAHMIIEYAPPAWQQMGIQKKTGIAALQQIVDIAGFKAPWVFPNGGEHLGPGLSADATRLLGVDGFRQLVDINAFVDDRLAKKAGCNLLLVPGD